MKGAIYQIAAVLSLATAINAGPVAKVAKTIIGARDVVENDVGSLFRRYPAPALTTAEIKAKLAKGEAFHPEIEKAMKAAGIQPPPGRAPPTPKKVARGPPANKKAFHPANVAANIKAGQVPADIVKMAKDAGYIVPPNIGGKPAPPKRDLSSLYAREAEAEAEAEAYFEERDAYPEAYFEDDDLYARDADADAYFEERDAYYDEDIYA